MMDFTDITSAVKKTTKKAADLAMKPVNFVANPVIEANNKLKRSVFGPDLTMLETLKNMQQQKLFHTNYFAHLEVVSKVLKGKKMPVKKLDAYIQACKLIEAAPDKTKTGEEKVDLMQELFDELRTSCKEGIPTKLKDNVFSIDKKVTYSAEEFSIISEQIATTKKFLNTLFNSLENDMIPLFLTKKPDAEGALLAAKEKRTHLGDQQKLYQDAVFMYNDEINAGRSLIRQIIAICDTLRKYTNNQNSLFGPEKSKYTAASDSERKKLTTLLTKDFSARQKKVAKQGAEVAKLQKEQDTYIPNVGLIWTKFYTTWQARQTSMQTDRGTTKKNYAQLLSATQKSLSKAQKTLQESHAKTNKILVEPYDQIEMFGKQKEIIHTQHTTLHDEYLALAEHNRTTGISAEIPLCSEARLIEQRVNYLSEEMSILRQQILYTKLIKRVWNTMADTIRGFENKLDDRKVYVKDLLTTPLKQLRTLTTELQERVKFLEKQIIAHDALLTKDKEELWDSISFNRLSDLKRTWHQDMVWSTLGATHSIALSSEIKTQTERKKMLEALEKNMHKKQNIDHTALDEQEKTVTLVKTKEQKEKLMHLKKQVHAQEQMQKAIAEEKESCVVHLEETLHLQKKYEIFGKNHQAHAQRYKKLIDEVSKKLTKSPLKQWVACDNKVTSMFS